MNRYETTAAPTAADGTKTTRTRLLEPDIFAAKKKRCDTIPYPYDTVRCDVMRCDGMWIGINGGSNSAKRAVRYGGDTRRESPSITVTVTYW